MWEKFKENAYALVSVGYVCSVLGVLGTIVANENILFQEPNKWLLWFEIIFSIFWLVWGIERLLKDWRK